MKKSYISLLAIAAMAAVSCAEKEPQMTIGEPVEMTFEASAKTMTKTQLTDENKVIWCKSDKISVFDGAANNMFGIINFQENSGAATFQGTAAADATYYAAYPYNAENELSGSTISLTLPASQTATSGTFAYGYALAVAKASEGSLAFKNVTALVKVTLAQDVTGIKSISLKGNKDEAIAGTVSVTLGEDGSISSIVPAGETQVTLEGDLKAGNSYYFTIAGDVAFTKGLTFTITLSNDKPVVISSEDAVTIEKGTIIPLFTSLSSDRWTPTLEFGEENSFDYAAAQTFTGERIATAELVSAPEGWTADLTDGIKIIAPAQTAVAAQGSTVVPKGNVVLNLTADNGTSTQVSVPVRLKGINDVNELNAFKTAYSASYATDKSQLITSTTNPELAKYMVNDVITINSDITVPRCQHFFVQYISSPVDGNNKTLTVDIYGSAGGGVCAFTQYLCQNVKNLKIAGQIKAKEVAYTTACCVAGFAGSVYKNLTIDNVHVSAAVEYSPTGVTDRNKTTTAKSMVGGIVGNLKANDLNINIKNCTYSGTMTVNYRPKAIGGIIAESSGQGRYVGDGSGSTRETCGLTTISGCSFTGEINLNPTVNREIKGGTSMNGYCRCGGITGDVSRNCIINENTISAGVIEIDAYGYAAEWVENAGGVVGNKTNVAQLDMTGVTSSTVITITNLNTAQTTPADQFDPLVGISTNKDQGYMKCTDITCTGKVIYSYHNNGAAAGEITTSKHTLN